MIPAYHDAQSSYTGVDRLKGQVAWSEIKLFIVGWVVWDMHFAVFSSYAAVGVKYHCCVMVESWQTFFKERGDEYRSVFFGRLAVESGNISWDGSSQLVGVDIFCLTKVEAVM